MSDNKFTLPESISEYFGISDSFDSFDDFKSFFDKEFIRKKNAHLDDEIKKKAQGHLFGTIRTDIKRVLKNNGFEVSGADFENDDISNVLSSQLDKYKSTYDNKIKELEDKISSPDEALSKLQEKFETIKKRNKEIEEQLNNVVSEKEEITKSFINKEKNWKIDSYKKEIFDKIKWKNDITELEKTGFNTLLSSKLKFDVEDNGEIFVTNDKGDRLPNPKTTGTFLSPFDAVNTLAIEHSLIAKTEGTKEYKPKTNGQFNQHPNNVNGSLNGRFQTVSRPFNM